MKCTNVDTCLISDCMMFVVLCSNVGVLVNVCREKEEVVYNVVVRGLIKKERYDI